MKKFFYLMSLCLCMFMGAAALSSCGDDDDNTTPGGGDNNGGNGGNTTTELTENYFTINGNKIQAKKYVYFSGTNPKSYLVYVSDESENWRFNFTIREDMLGKTIDLANPQDVTSVINIYAGNDNWAYSQTFSPSGNYYSGDIGEREVSGQGSAFKSGTLKVTLENGKFVLDCNCVLNYQDNKLATKIVVDESKIKDYNK